jgi:hypothetical protein
MPDGLTDLLKQRMAQRLKGGIQNIGGGPPPPAPSASALPVVRPSAPVVPQAQGAPQLGDTQARMEAKFHALMQQGMPEAMALKMAFGGQLPSPGPKPPMPMDR